VGGRIEGQWMTGRFEASSWDEISKQLEFNLVLPMRLTHRLLPELLRPSSDGQPINASLIYISSQAGYFARPGVAAYGAAKAALNSFAGSIFEELREQGVRVCVVSPGMVGTPLHPESPRLDRSKMISADEVARAVGYALACEPRSCPVEIHLRPQRDPIRR
jgi:short-subunit dehydrogenase